MVKWNKDIAKTKLPVDTTSELKQLPVYVLAYMYIIISKHTNILHKKSYGSGKFKSFTRNENIFGRINNQ